MAVSAWVACVGGGLVYMYVTLLWAATKVTRKGMLFVYKPPLRVLLKGCFR
jgi:hypothetical protein